jgi:hypothetical protein
MEKNKVKTSDAEKLCHPPTGGFENRKECGTRPHLPLSCKAHGTQKCNCSINGFRRDAPIIFFSLFY